MVNLAVNYLLVTNNAMLMVISDTIYGLINTYLPCKHPLTMLHTVLGEATFISKTGSVIYCSDYVYTQ